jgi:putative ABC transport system permease protein
VRTKNLGFEKEHVLVIDINSGNTRRSFETIKAEMSRLPEVKSVSVSSRVPGEWKNINEVSVIPIGFSMDQPRTMNFISIDSDFLKTFQIDLVAGRNFSGSSPADTSSVILNEAAVRALGLDDPLGKEITTPSNQYRARVIGVVKDFHYRSLHEVIGPLILGHWSNPITPIDYFTLRFQTADVSGLLTSLEKIHGSFDMVTPLEYNFLDDRIEDFYRDDERVGEIVAIAAILAIVIASLGLLGLVSYVTEQRTKEIGVRKVLGATVPNILMLLWKDFALLVWLATVIGSPIAYLVLHFWLQDFAYRIEIGWWIFVAAGLFALLIALLTVSVQTVRAAVANPVEALRYE